MLLVELTLISLLLLQGISGEAIFIYRKPGELAVLPCSPDGSYPSTCSTVIWTYKRDQNKVFFEVHNGNVLSTSGRAGRLSVDSNCSLVIEPVSAEDVGFYVCRQRRDRYLDVSVYLSLLTVSPKDAGPQTDGEVPLECSLLAYSDNNPCQRTTFLWMNETGSVLHKDDNMNCVSVLTVKRPSGSNRTFTCQLVEDNAVLREAHYTLRSTNKQAETSDCEPAAPTGWSGLSLFMLILHIAELILLIIITVHIVKTKCSKKPPDNENNVNNVVQYENVDARRAAATRQ